MSRRRSARSARLLSEPGLAADFGRPHAPAAERTVDRLVDQTLAVFAEAIAEAEAAGEAAAHHPEGGPDRRPVRARQHLGQRTGAARRAAVRRCALARPTQPAVERTVRHPREGVRLRAAPACHWIGSRWLGRLQRIVARLCLRGEVDAVLAHMGPVFAVAAAPIARLAGLPTFLWYAHGHVSPMLRLAHALVDGVGTSTPEGFRIASPKVTITGQGIDLERFRPAERWPEQ